MTDALRLVALVGDQEQALWNSHTAEELDFGEVGAPFPPREHLEFIEQEGGEKLAFVTAGDRVAGWIGLVPKTDERGGYSDLAGIGVPRPFRGTGVASRLIDAAQAWLAERGIYRLEFGTSPLLVPNTLLYLCRCGSSYTYQSGTLPFGGGEVPWPFVTCSMPLPRQRNEYRLPNEATVRARSVLTWTGHRPRIEEARLNSGADSLWLLLPFLDVVPLSQDLETTGGELLKVADRAFTALTAQGYRIAGFGKLGGDYAYALEKTKVTG